MLATAMAGAASERATVSSGISATWVEAVLGGREGEGEGGRGRKPITTMCMRNMRQKRGGKVRERKGRDNEGRGIYWKKRSKKN